MCKFCDRGLPKIGAWHPNIYVSEIGKYANVLCQDHLIVHDRREGRQPTHSLEPTSSKAPANTKDAGEGYNGVA